MHRALLAILALSACGRPAGPVVTGPTERPPSDLERMTPLSAGFLPQPPAQDEAWSPPSSPLADGARLLFEQGLADPRRCAYREIRITVGSVWGSSGELVTHGFVLPDGAHAVAWNGLVYPVAAAGPEADLDADVAQMIARDAEDRRRQEADWPGSGLYRHRRAWSEEESTSHETLLPIRAVLLLRLGETELASSLWTAWLDGMRAGTNDDAVHLRDPYLMLAVDYAWALFDRAVAAHMRGDDRLALASAEALLPLRRAVEEAARARGFTVQCPQAEGCVYLSFLEPLDALVRDQRRRAGPQPEAPADPVLAAVARLDEVAARQWSQPGGVDPSTDPIVQELVRLGPDAIEPLVRVVEDDARLTRSVEFHRDFSHGRFLLGVQHAAFAALSEILGTRSLVPELDLRSDDGRHAAAAAIRRFARSHADASPAERWLAVLGDDGASAEQWLEAAVSITGLPGTSPTTGWGSGASPPNRIPSPMPGESLRARRPGPTALMVKRLQGFRRDSSQVAPGTPYRVDVLQACRMAVLVGVWDPAGAAPVLREEIDRAERLLARMDPLQDGFDAEYLVLCAAQHTLALVRGGDGNALADYTRFLRALPRAMVGSNTRFAFEPIWVHHDDPAVVAFARWAFTDPASPWLPITGDEQTDELLETPMVQLAAFRDRVLVELADRGRYGEVRVLEQGGIAIEGDAGRQDSIGYPREELPARGTILTVRRCDYTAHLLLSRRPPQDAPAFRIHWPVGRRDRAIAELTAYLRALPPLP